MSNEDLDFAKVKTKEEAKTYNNKPQNFSNDEFIALQNLSKNEDFIIQKSNKGNSLVIVNRKDYKKKMDIALSDIALNSP